MLNFKIFQKQALSQDIYGKERVKGEIDDFKKVDSTIALICKEVERNIYNADK